MLCDLLHSVFQDRLYSLIRCSVLQVTLHYLFCTSGHTTFPDRKHTLDQDYLCFRTCYIQDTLHSLSVLRDTVHTCSTSGHNVLFRTQYIFCSILQDIYFKTCILSVCTSGHSAQDMVGYMCTLPLMLKICTPHHRVIQ